MSEPWEDLQAELAQRLEAPGFDIFGATTVGAYNQTLDENFQGYRLPEPAGEDSLVLVIGNARRLWPVFLRAYVTPPLCAERHPIDAYTRVELSRAVNAVSSAFEVESALRYTFDPLPRAVAAQRLTVLAGAAESSPVGLLIHPDYGPWFSLRAAAVFGVAGPSPSRMRAHLLHLCRQTLRASARASQNRHGRHLQPRDIRRALEAMARDA